MEPLTRTARELGESSAAFERAVLAFLGTDSDGNRAETGVRRRATGAGRQRGTGAGRAVRRGRRGPAGRGHRRHQALGFELASDAHGPPGGRSTAWMPPTGAWSAGSAPAAAAGIRVGETVLTRPDDAGTRGRARRGARRRHARCRCRRTRGRCRRRRARPASGPRCDRHDSGAAPVAGRRLALAGRGGLRRGRAAAARRATLRAAIEPGRGDFAAAGEALAARIRERVRGPGLDPLREATRPRHGHAAARRARTSATPWPRRSSRRCWCWPSRRSRNVAGPPADRGRAPARGRRPHDARAPRRGERGRRRWHGPSTRWQRSSTPPSATCAATRRSSSSGSPSARSSCSTSPSTIRSPTCRTVASCSST